MNIMPTPDKIVEKKEKSSRTTIPIFTTIMMLQIKVQDKKQTISAVLFISANTIGFRPENIIISMDA